jgi:hypothetical protein
MSSDFRRKALDVFRQSRETQELERKKRLILLAQAWLNLADHDARVRGHEGYDALSDAGRNRPWSEPNSEPGAGDADCAHQAAPAQIAP